MFWRKHPLVRSGVGHVLAGAAVVVPVVLVGLAAWTVVDLLAGVFAPAYALAARTGVEGPLLVPAVTTVIAVLGLGAIGIAVRHRYGERAVDALDRTVSRIPGVGPIYRRSRPSASGLDPEAVHDELCRTRAVVTCDADDRFTDVVLVELVDGGHVLGFVVGDAPTPIGAAADDNDLVTVHVPIAPSPTLGGHLFHLRPERLRETDLTVPNALAMLVTMGKTSEERDEADGGLTGMFNVERPENVLGEETQVREEV
jgi:uncharacterized membrane protein